MALVRLVGNYTWDYARQSPGGRFDWQGTSFTQRSVPKCDALVILNDVPHLTTVTVPPNRIINVLQEPPDSTHKWWHKGNPNAYAVVTPDTSRQGEKYIHSHGALPWHVGRTYDALIAQEDPPKKSANISWITSNLTLTHGHRQRLDFLTSLKKHIDFELYGRGFHYIEDKWDGLAPFRYTIAVESFRSEHYWTEKLADGLLAWCLPFYAGASKIGVDLPEDAVIPIPLDDPARAAKIMRDAINSDLWAERLDAIREARRLILQKHQLLPFIADILDNLPSPEPDQAMEISPLRPPLRNRIKARLERLKSRR